MSLEQAIEANTAAIRELIETFKREKALQVDAIDRLAARIGTETGVPAALKEELEPEAKKPTPAPTENPVTSPSGAEPQSVTAPAVQEPISVDLMKDVVPPFGKLCVAKGRDAGAAILAKWNVTKLSQVPKDKWADLLADIEQRAAA